MSSQDQAPYVAACPECDATQQTDSPNEIIDFYRRHYRVTGHDIKIKHADTDLDTGITAQDLKGIIRQLEEHHQNGVPVGIIAAVMNERGLSVKETLDQIHEIRMGGGLYEPQDDHLCAF
ncbi:hypothetical protein [Haladaptatus halobius]|uniref:hypothetical protein n=1 Tax=Haladaptatus halobius TaxID=2884875 RepID=UPI001D0BB2C3|nr:hypothetical protein [Haladaptatus halobius]